MSSLLPKKTNMYMVAQKSRPSFSMAHSLRIFYCRGALCTRVNPDTLRVDREVFESGKKKVASANKRVQALNA